MVMDQHPHKTMQREKIVAPGLRLVGNKMTNDLFYTFAHTPLATKHGDSIGYRIVVCLSGHDFTIKEHKLAKSGLTVRNNDNGINNIQTILQNDETIVVLVSQMAKKKFDRETVLQPYKARIFCLLKDKKGMTNKIPSHPGKIKQVYIRH